MDEREANIDILFRNGLKDYEALPPAEIWDSLQPAIRKRQRPVLIFRAAATIAVLLSLSLLTYRWSSEVSEDLLNQSFALDEESAAPERAGSAGSTAVNEETLTPAFSPAVSTEFQILREEAVMTVAFNQGQYLQVPEVNNSLSVDRRRESFVPEITEVMAIGSFYNYPENEKLSGRNDRIPGSRWSVGALISPTYYSRLSSGNNEALASKIASDQAVISYSGGVALSYKVNRRLTVSSGVYYSSIGQQLNGIVAYSGFSDHINTKGVRNFLVETINGTVQASNADVYLTDNLAGDRVITRYTKDVFDPVKSKLDYIDNSLRQNFSYLELPVLLRYKIIDKTVDLNIIGGMSTNLLVSNSVDATLDGQKIPVGDTEGLNSVTFSSSFGMGMEYNFSKSVSVSLEPTIRYYLNPFSEIPGIKVHPYSFGIFSGLTYKF